MDFDETVYDDLVASNKFSLAEELLMWIVLYSVKASFLALMWSIFHVSASFRKFWWAVTTYTFLAFWISFASPFWQCGNPLNYADPKACTEIADQLASSREYLTIPRWIRFILHISSDCFILVLPLNCIRKLQMRRSRKISTAAIFAIIIVDITMGIIKNIAALSSNLLDQDYYGFFYEMSLVCQYVEPGLAIIVCALPVYRVLLPSSQKRIPSEERLRDNTVPISPQSPQKVTPTDTSEEEARLVREPEMAYIMYECGRV